MTVSTRSDIASRLPIRAQILTCTNCSLSSQCRSPVPFSGMNPNPYVVIGEAPGKVEDDRGEPFVGPAGSLLRRAIDKVFKGEMSDYFSYLNAVSCYPPSTPTVKQVRACRDNLEGQLEVLRPRYGLVCGGTALGAFLPDEKARTRLNTSVVPPATVSALRGLWLEMKREWGTWYALVVWHPAAVLREGGLGVGKGQELLLDLEKFRDVVYRNQIKGEDVAREVERVPSQLALG